MNENLGTIIDDGTPNANDGTLSGAQWVSDALDSYAIQFDGVDDYIEVPELTSINNIKFAITIEAWVKTSSTSSQVVISRFAPTGTSCNWELEIENNCAKFFVSEDGTWNSGWVANSNTVVNDGQWHHLAGAYMMAR